MPIIVMQITLSLIDSLDTIFHYLPIQIINVKKPSF